MFLETTYLESPSASPILPAEEPLPPVQKEEAIEDRYQDTPVNHLIFVIHGIGQQTEQYGQFYEHMESLRETTRQVLQAKVPDHNVRIELIPIEWHKHLHDHTDPDMNKITLKSIPTIRLIENDYLADVMYYFSKDRGQLITDNVTNLFNTSYRNFMAKNPNFDGKIAIYGYSLGGIITWDILSHQREPANDTERAEYAKLDVIYPKLDFKPDFFFGLGSPVGAILIFRNQSPKHYRPDDSIVFENIFHPFDPLAYRFEPLLLDHYTDEAAVLIERSIPLGPTFSLPALPSFPGASMLSLFSRFTFSYGSSKNAPSSPEGIIEASDEAVGEDDRQLSYWKWMTEYFGSYQGHKKKGTNKNTQHDEEGEGDHDGEMRHHDRNSNMLGLKFNEDHTSFDGFDGPKVIDCTNDDENVFDEEASTKWAGGVLTGTYDFVDRLRPRRLGSRFDKNGILTSGILTSAIAPEKNDYFSIPNDKNSTRHSVDVYNNDGSKLDNSTISKITRNNSSDLLNQLSMDLSSPLSPNAQQEYWSKMPSNSKTSTDQKRSSDSKNSITEESAEESSAMSMKSRNSNNLMDDLNKEIHEPGAKFMQPTQSTESITKDATVPNEGDQENATSNLSEDEQKPQLPARIDYVLQPESFMDMLTNEYIVGFRAHFSYWTNKDLQWHILRHLENLEEPLETSN
ncbi:hypothetical protein INT43_000560 [Umbelopsis isabellina]|uniref:DDHD domain-containing protein n=1 Tax=Mortierella isabellina TaxID=91625 RepID=A0A8H7Q1Z6_MORIS|nr:hypothetical protein INT43_000560 [Umbelopsis isabellina]